MNIQTNLLHNMSAPPKSVVRYEGLSGMATQGSPGGSGLTSVSFRGKSLFGTAIRFDLPPDWIGLKPLDLLSRLQMEADELSGGERSGTDHRQDRIPHEHPHGEFQIEPRHRKPRQADPPSNEHERDVSRFERRK